MGSKATTSLAYFLALNLIFFTLVNACGDCPKPKPPPSRPPPPKITTPHPPKTHGGKCPKDTLKLAACADLLGLISVTIGSPPTKPCCSLLNGLADLEAALCLCIAIKANVLGINLNVPLSLSVILNNCGKKVPTGFQCP